MIKNIEDFPRLNIFQKLENSKLTIQMCDEGIEEMTNEMVCLILELECTLFEHEKMEIIRHIRYFEEYISSIINSRNILENEVKRLSYVFN